MSEVPSCAFCRNADGLPARHIRRHTIKAQPTGCSAISSYRLGFLSASSLFPRLSRLPSQTAARRCTPAPCCVSKPQSVSESHRLSSVPKSCPACRSPRSGSHRPSKPSVASSVAPMCPGACGRSSRAYVPNCQVSSPTHPTSERSSCCGWPGVLPPSSPARQAPRR